MTKKFQIALFCFSLHKFFFKLNKILKEGG